jgi:hypothetical protein
MAQATVTGREIKAIKLPRQGETDIVCGKQTQLYGGIAETLSLICLKP